MQEWGCGVQKMENFTNFFLNFRVETFCTSISLHNFYEIFRDYGELHDGSCIKICGDVTQ